MCLLFRYNLIKLRIFFLVDLFIWVVGFSRLIREVAFDFEAKKKKIIIINIKYKQDWLGGEGFGCEAVVWSGSAFMVSKICPFYGI